jgi:hypothetical protein
VRVRRGSSRARRRRRARARAGRDASLQAVLACDGVHARATMRDHVLAFQREILVAFSCARVRCIRSGRRGRARQQNHRRRYPATTPQPDVDALHRISRSSTPEGRAVRLPFGTQPFQPSRGRLWPSSQLERSAAPDCETFEGADQHRPTDAGRGVYVAFDAAAAHAAIVLEEVDRRARRRQARAPWGRDHRPDPTDPR